MLRQNFAACPRKLFKDPHSRSIGASTSSHSLASVIRSLSYQAANLRGPRGPRPIECHAFGCRMQPLGDFPRLDRQGSAGRRRLRPGDLFRQFLPAGYFFPWALATIYSNLRYARRFAESRGMHTFLAHWCSACRPRSCTGGSSAANWPRSRSSTQRSSSSGIISTPFLELAVGQSSPGIALRLLFDSRHGWCLTRLARRPVGLPAFPAGPGRRLGGRRGTHRRRTCCFPDLGIGLGSG
jgi:hypothetical protein